MICLVLSESSLEKNVELVRRNEDYIDLVELRVDLLDGENQKRSASFPSLVSVPVILTCRREIDGGKYKGSEKERLKLMEEALEGSFSYIDIEEDVKRSQLEQMARDKKVRIIRSKHDFKEVPADIFHLISRLANKGDIPKVAVMPNSVADLITLFKVRQELSEIEEKIVVGMGEYGYPSRILYKKIGSMLTFCSDKEVAPGQISAKKMKQLYRADTIDDQSRIYGIIGQPVLHSLSPQIHNRGFKEIKFNAIYLPFTVDSVRSFFSLAEMIKIAGFSVTVPHKQAVLPYLGKISREAKQIGSCNTVVRKQNFWSGLNTDYYGFLEPINGDLESKKIETALVVGSGGAARAVVWALRNRGCKVTIVNRSVERARLLAQETMAQYDTLENAPLYSSVDLVVQTTSVGLESDEDPIPSFIFNENQVVYELIYTPHYTKMLKRAKEANCRIVFGLEMLIGQAMLQFEAFSGYHWPKRLEVKLSEED